MITKNKQSPATLYLLNAKNMTKCQEQKKSARLSFNKKKSSRSISQYQKWNPNKQVSGVPFQPVSKTNSEIKRIVLSRNQFGLETLSLQKKLGEIVNIFGRKGRRSSKVSEKKCNQKQRVSKSGQLSLLSLKDEGKHVRSRSHVRTQSILKQTQQQDFPSLEQTLSLINYKFKEYDEHSEEWKLRYLTGQSDYLLDQMIKIFRMMMNDTIMQFRHIMVGNIDYCEKSIMKVANEYQVEVSQLREQVRRIQGMKNVMGNLVQAINEKHHKSLVSSIIWETIQKKGTDLEQILKQSSAYEQIVKLTTKQSDMNSEVSQFFNSIGSNPIHDPVLAKLIQQSSHQQQHQDCVQDQNWNQHFQSNQCIKGVLKYIHNHNSKQHKKKNPNPTGLKQQINSEKKIQNWRSFEKNQKSIGNFKKILSQR